MQKTAWTKHIKFFNDLDDPPKDIREAAEILFDHWLNIDFISASGEKYVPNIGVSAGADEEEEE